MAHLSWKTVATILVALRERHFRGAVPESVSWGICGFVDFELWKFCSKLKDAVLKFGEVKIISASRAMPEGCWSSSLSKQVFAIATWPIMRSFGSVFSWLKGEQKSMQWLANVCIYIYLYKRYKTGWWSKMRHLRHLQQTAYWWWKKSCTPVGNMSIQVIVYWGVCEAGAPDEQNRLDNAMY